MHVCSVHKLPIELLEDIRDYPDNKQADQELGVRSSAVNGNCCRPLPPVAALQYPPGCRWVGTSWPGSRALLAG